jgi:hypothetical protein
VEANSLIQRRAYVLRRKSLMVKKNKNWIQKAVKKPGALRKTLGVKAGQKIPAKKLRAAAKKPGKTGQRARLAETFKKMRRKKS